MALPAMAGKAAVSARSSDERYGSRSQNHQWLALSLMRTCMTAVSFRDTNVTHLGIGALPWVSTSRQTISRRSHTCTALYFSSLCVPPNTTSSPPADRRRATVYMSVCMVGHRHFTAG